MADEPTKPGDGAPAAAAPVTDRPAAVVAAAPAAAPAAVEQPMPAPVDLPRQKRESVERSLAAGPVLLTVDARECTGLPEQFACDFALRINFSPKYEPPDLVVDSVGIRETLSFSGVPHPVRCPWSAVWMLRAADGAEATWLSSLPVEIARACAEEAFRLKALVNDALAMLQLEAASVGLAERPPVDWKAWALRALAVTRGEQPPAPASPPLVVPASALRRVGGRDGRRLFEILPGGRHG